MTREEAKEILTHNWTRVDNPNYSESELDEAFFMAIEALSAEPSKMFKEFYDTEKGETMSDLIKREDAIGCCNCHGSIDCTNRINALPSADAEWIPCSERLPKEKQEVYVTVYFIEGDTGRAYGYMDGFGKWHLCSTVEGTLNSGYEVLAWMPLPKPYKGGEDK